LLFLSLRTTAAYQAVETRRAIRPETHGAIRRVVPTSPSCRHLLPSRMGRAITRKCRRRRRHPRPFHCPRQGCYWSARSVALPRCAAFARRSDRKKVSRAKQKSHSEGWLTRIRDWPKRDQTDLRRSWKARPPSAPSKRNPATGTGVVAVGVKWNSKSGLPKSAI